METEKLTERLVLILDLIAMVIATISFPGFFFLLANQNIQTSSSTGSNYNNAMPLFWLAIFLLICFVFFFGKALKSYVYHQLTRDDIMVLRMISYGFILGSLILYFMFFFLRP